MKQLVVAAAAVLALALAPTAHAKPVAPVEVHLAAVAVHGGFQVTLTAAPTRDVPALVLRLAGKQVAFPATRARQVRTLVVTVAVADGAGVDVVGVATAAARTRAALVHLGAVAAKPAPPPAVTRTLPDGRAVAEVR